VIFGRGWWNAQEERALRLNTFVTKVLDEFPNARRATITSPACNGLTCPTVWMSREQRTFGNALFVNLARIPFLVSEADLLHMAAEVSDWSPQFLDVDPVHGARFALYCEQHGLKFPSLKFILCSYEFVSVVHRKILARVFGVPVFNLYGSTETGHLLMENERGEMKPSYDTAFLEIVNTDARGVGELVVTTLTNDYMPLLRYRIGDLVEQNILPYGNHFTVHGRARDALAASDGQGVTTWQVDKCFAGASGIAHYELRQSENGGCVLRFVPDGVAPTEKELRRVTSQLEALLKPSTKIKTVAMEVLVPAASGKFRLTCRAGAI
jgi:phenylacetate-CoA ligase